MSDPLTLLRQATSNNALVTSSDGNCIIDGKVFSETSKTAFKRTLRGDYYYSLKDILFFLDNVGLSVADYRRKAVEAKVTAVVEQDRPSLLNYLQGKIDTCQQIDQEVINSYNAQLVQGDNASKKKEQKSKVLEIAKQTAVQDKTLKSRGQKRKLDAEQISIPTYDANRKLLQSVRSNESAPINRVTVLNAQGMDFAMALKIFNDRVLKPKDLVKTATESAHNPTVDEISHETRPSRSDIIIVPKSLTSMITLQNAKEFLCDGVYYRPTDPNLEANRNPPATKVQAFLRKMTDNSTKPYKIIDDATKLPDQDWDRVVAVFVSGQLWQFRGWKYSDPTSLLSKVRGFHLMHDGSPIDANIQSWNCKIIKINEFKPYVNASASKDFWLMLDEFSRIKKLSSK